MPSIELIPIVDLDSDHQFWIRDMRNRPEVRKVMFTDHVIGVNEHLRWISKLKSDRSQIVFGIIADRVLGVIGIQQVDLENRRAEWGFYLAPEERGKGIGRAVERRFLEFAFETLALEKLNGAVLEGNDDVLQFYLSFGFVEEGFRRSDVLKSGNRIGVHLLGLTKQDWTSKRNAVASDTYDVKVRWRPEEQVLTPIDQIEAARARNNVNWMNILRIAIEKSPVHAKEIVADIQQLDRQISELTGRIITD